MKKFLSMIAVLVMVLPLLVLSVGAVPTVDSSQKVHDLAGLFTNEEIDAMQGQINAYQAEFSFDAVVVTTNNAEGLSSVEYADDFYDYNHFGYSEGTDKTMNNGILILIDMDNRQLYISTTGMAIRVYDDPSIERMLDKGFGYMPNGEYGKAALAVLQEAHRIARAEFKKALQGPKGEEEIRQFIDENFDYANLQQASSRESLAENLKRSALIGAIGSIAVVLILLGIHKRSLPKAPSASSYNGGENIAIHRRNDSFVNTYTSRRRLPDESSSGNSGNSGGGFGSGGSSHSSSSGTSHGGGGRSF